MYRGGLNRACTNLCVFDPSFINIQELEPEKAINYKPVKNLMEQTSDLKLWLKLDMLRKMLTSNVSMK